MEVLRDGVEGVVSMELAIRSKQTPAIRFDVGVLAGLHKLRLPVEKLLHAVEQRVLELFVIDLPAAQLLACRDPDREKL